MPILPSLDPHSLDCDKVDAGSAIPLFRICSLTEIGKCVTGKYSGHNIFLSLVFLSHIFLALVFLALVFLHG